jgi:hypothetical protein
MVREGVGAGGRNDPSNLKNKKKEKEKEINWERGQTNKQ